MFTRSADDIQEEIEEKQQKETDDHFDSASEICETEIELESLNDLSTDDDDVKTVTEIEQSDNQQEDVFQTDDSPNTNLPPKDHYNYVFIVVTLLGLVHMLPYTFFLTANEYWMYKFRNASADNATATSDATNRTYLQTNFATWNTMIMNVVSLLMNFLLIFVAHKIAPITRILGALITHTIIFSIEAIFVYVNTDSWQTGFFVFTMITFAIALSSASLGTVGLFGLISLLPKKYLKCYLLGEGFAAFFNAILRLISLIISPSARDSALIYFCSGAVIVFISILLIIFTIRTEFFIYYTRSTKEDKKQKIRSCSEIKSVLIYIWQIMIIMGIFFGAPLGSINSLVVSEHKDDPNNVWANRYFVTVCTYLIPSVTNVLGRIVYNIFTWDIPLPFLYIIASFYTVASMILLFFSNAQPRYHTQVLIKPDWAYALIMSSSSMAQGLIMNAIVMKVYISVPDNRRELGLLVAIFSMNIITAVIATLGFVAVDSL